MGLRALVILVLAALLGVGSLCVLIWAAVQSPVVELGDGLAATLGGFVGVLLGLVKESPLTPKVALRGEVGP